MQCTGTINCSAYSSGVKHHQSPQMPEDLCEKCIRLIYSLTGRYSTDFNYRDLFSQFFTCRRMLKDSQEEEEQKRDEEKFREFSHESDEDDDDAKEDEKKEEKEEGKGKEKDEKDEKYEEKEGNQFDYKSINNYINQHREKQL